MPLINQTEHKSVARRDNDVTVRDVHNSTLSKSTAKLGLIRLV